MFSGSRVLAILAFSLGLAAILGALAFEHIGGLVPCVLCLTQRLPYYIGLPVLAVVIFGWDLLPVPLRLALTALAGGLFAWGAGLGVYHAGVEWGIFEGPQSCSGIGEATISFDMLSALDEAPRIIPCDAVQWEFLGISLAGYNALIAAAIVALLAVSGWKQFKAWRA